MIAVLTAQEPSAKYLVNLQPPLVRHFDLIAQAPGGVALLRELILTLAVQGKLVPQDTSDEPAIELLKKIRAEKDRLIADKKLKREKDEPALMGNALPFDLPETWAWVALGEVIDIVRGITFPATQKTREAAPGRIACLRTSNVQQYIEWDDLLFVDRSFMGREDQLIQHHDIVMSMANSRELVGKVALIDQIPHAEATFGGFLGVLRPRKIDPRYAMVVLRTPYARSLLIDSSSQTTNIANVSLAKLRPLPFPLPSEAEQSRIVTRVDELMQVCDALEASGQLEAQQHGQLVSTLLGTLTQSETPEVLAENWQRIATHFDVLLDHPEAVDALEQTILQLAVRGLLVPQDPTDEPASVLLQKIRTEKDHLIAQGKIKRDKPLPPITDEEKPFELPQGWQLTRLGASIELISGQHLGPDEYVEGLDGGIPYLTGPAEFGVESPSPTRSTKETRAVASSGDILITVKGSGVGKLNVVRHPEIAISRQLMAIRPLGVNFDFVLLVLKTMGLKFQAQAVGIAIPGIGREDVAGSLVALPPFAEQLRIVTRVNEIRGLCAGLRQSLASVQTAQLLISNVLIGSFNNFLNPTETNGLSN